MDVLKVGSPAEKNTKMVTTLATLMEEGRTSEVGEWYQTTQINDTGQNLELPSPTEIRLPSTVCPQIWSANLELPSPACPQIGRSDFEDS